MFVVAIQNESSTHKRYSYVLEEIKINKSKYAWYYFVNSNTSSVTNIFGQNNIRDNEYAFLSIVTFY